MSCTPPRTPAPDFGARLQTCSVQRCSVQPTAHACSVPGFLCRPADLHSLQPHCAARRACVAACRCARGAMAATRAQHAIRAAPAARAPPLRVARRARGGRPGRAAAPRVVCAAARGEALEIEVLPKEEREGVMAAVEDLGYRVTAGDVAAAAGVPVHRAEEALKKLAADAGGALKVRARKRASQPTASCEGGGGGRQGRQGRQRERRPRVCRPSRGARPWPRPAQLTKQ